MYELQAVCATAKDMTANFININWHVLGELIVLLIPS